MSLAASLDSPTLLAVFQALPGAYLLLSPEFIIEEVSNAYLSETLTERDQLVGHYLFEVFPDNPQAQEAYAVRNLRASLEQVLATGQPQQMALQHYDVPDRQQPSRFVERYWLPTNTPICNAEGQVRHLLHSVVNVTDQWRVEAQLRDSQRRERAAHADATHQRAQLGRIFWQAPAAICILTGPDFVFELVNPAYQALFPNRQLLGKPMLEVLPELVGHSVHDSLRQVYETGQTQEETSRCIALARAADGVLEDRYFNYTQQARYNAQGRVDGVLVFAFEVTPQVQASQLVRATIDSSTAIIQGFEAVRDETGRIVDFRWTLVNEPAAAQYDITLVGRRLLDLNPGVVETGIFERFVQVVQSGQPQAYEQEYRHEQYYGWFEQSVVRLGDGVVSTTTNITARKQAEEALRAAHARTVDILESTADAFYALDADFRFTYVNQRAAQLWGREREALLGRHSWAEFPAAVGSVFYQQHYRVQAEGQPAHFETVSPLVGLWIDVSIYPGSEGGLSVFFRDITARKTSEQALRHSERRLQQAFSIETVGVIFFDSAGCIHAANAAFQHLSGYPSPAFQQGQVHWDELTPPEFRAAMHYAQHELLTQGQSTPYEQQCLRPDGTRWWALFAGKRLSENEYVAFGLDITERKQATHQLQSFNEQLQRVNVDLDNFIYTASHDLKAPIANLEGLLLALQEELPAAAYVGDVAAVLRMMQDAIERFGRTIGHLTDISRLHQVYEQPATQVLVAPVVHEVLLDLAPFIAKTNAQLTVAIPEHVRLTFSEKNLRSVVYNLVSNALKYRHPDRVPEVVISCQPQDDYQVLAVQDNGLGLDLSRGDEKLFGMFQRLHTHVEGTGIGLYMVKKLLKNAGGRIEVQSELNQQTTFRAYFPLAEATLSNAAELRSGKA